MTAFDRASGGFRVAAGLLAAAFAACGPLRAGEAEARGEKYLLAVRTFGDNVLARGRDTYGPRKTPLFVDGLNVDTLKPPVWRRDGQEWVLSNLASQQNLFRTLVGLSAATGDPKYRRAAVGAIAYAFKNLQDAGGLLRWGGHTCYDALGDRVVSEAGQHELKHHYPYYELMWQVDPNATRRLIEAIWTAHVIRWDILDVNRHGRYGRKAAEPWGRKYTGGKVPFVGRGLSFMMSGTDFIVAAGMLSRFTGRPEPLTWARRLAMRYVDARHPKTGLGASNFNTRPDHRMERQFPQFNGRFTEATVTDIYGCRYTYCAMSQLRLGEALGEKGGDFVRWAVEDLAARASHGYDEKDNSFCAMLIDGTRLSPADRKRDGYVKADWLRKRRAHSRYLLAYALAYRLSRKALMWRMVRGIGRGLGLGDLGAAPASPGRINLRTTSSDPLVIFALLELREATGRKAYLALAGRVADNVLAARFHKGFFVASADHVNARFDDPAGLALLHVRAAMQNLPERPPTYWGGSGYFHCPHDGRGRTYDNSVIYTQRRGR